MGKGIDNLSVVKRSEKLAFWGVGFVNSTHFVRVEAFTEMAFSKNAIEYTRRYVDEDTDRTDVTGYSESISYNFDRYVGHPVLEDLVSITENEKTGVAAVRVVAVVDLTTAVGMGNGVARAEVRRCTYTIVPDSNGNTNDCMTYSGNIKIRGVKEGIKNTLYAYSSDNWETIYFDVSGATGGKGTLTNISTSPVDLKTNYKPDRDKYTVELTTETEISFNVTASEETAYIISAPDNVVHNENAEKANTYTGLDTAGTYVFKILTVAPGGQSKTYTITVTKSE
ncbi:MAG: hypothetical protein IJZ64_02635 [Ruminococcus sp.]|nr:hypothetical protein [Ruminococcus sp.]